MSAADALKNLKDHLEAEAKSVVARIEQDLPEVERVVEDASANPLVAAASAAVHLPEIPALMQMFADFLTSVDNAIGDAKAKAAADAQAAASSQAPAPASDQPADPSAPAAPTA